MENIDKMTPDEMDREIARLRGNPFCKPKHGTCCTCQKCGWDYDNCQCGITEDIEAAWELVEEMKPLKVGVWFDDPTWSCGLTFENFGEIVDAPTAPLAICRAWLKWKLAQCNPVT